MALWWQPVEWKGEADVAPVVELRAIKGAGVYTVMRLASGAWWASHREPGCCAWCLGDNFPDAVAAARACDQHAGEL
jgi:hypothetical protein